MFMHSRYYSSIYIFDIVYD